MKFFNKIISWASNLPKGKMLWIDKKKPGMLLKKDVGLDELFNLKKNKKPTD